jgi:hypothetical protein
VSSCVPGNGRLGERRSDPSEPKQAESPTRESQGNENRTEVQTSAEHSLENQEDDSGRDVAAAIEGLLAQTSKVLMSDSLHM